jgi:hypothetical protein
VAHAGDTGGITDTGCRRDEPIKELWDFVGKVKIFQQNS